MFELARLLGFRHLRNQWLRTLLSLMGIVIGVTTFIFAPTVASTLVTSLDMTADDLAGTASLEITAEEGITPDMLSRIQNSDGVKMAVPSVNGGGLLLGQTELLAFWGINPALDRDMRTYTVANGDFIAQQGEALITQRYADDKNLGLTDTLTLIGTGGVLDLAIVGILADSGGVARLNSGDIIVMTLEDAQRVNSKSAIDTVHIVLADDASDEDVTANLLAQIEGIQVNPPASHLSNARESSMLLNMLMAIVTLMILTIGSFLIYNAVAVSVAQRRGEIGILRALGLEKRMIRRMFMAEAILMGCIGSILGIIGGYIMLSASSNLYILPRELVSSSPLQSKASFAVPIWLPILAFTMGILFPIIASYFASKEAIRIDPTEAMIQIRAEAGNIPFYPRRIMLAFGVIISAIVIRTLFNGDLATALMLSNVLTYAVLFAMVLLLAPLLVLLDRFVTWTNQRGWGLTSWLASLNLTHRPKRVLSTGILLAVGGMMFVYISQSNYGFTTFVDEWGNAENIGDLTLLGAGVNPLQPIVNIPQTVIDEVITRPDVIDGSAELMVGIESDGASYKIRAIDLTSFNRMGGQFVWNKGDEASAISHLTNHDMPSILVHMGQGIFTHNLAVGSVISLNTPVGIVDFDVVGTIYGSLGLDETTIVMDKSLYAQLWGDTNTNKFAIELADGADIHTIRRELLAQYALQGVVVYDVADVTQAFAKRMVSISTVSSLLSGLFTIIIAVGLGSTFYVLILDRRREIGMLRALGMTSGQIRNSIFKEGLLLFFLTCILSVPSAYLATSIQQIGIQNMMGFKFELQAYQVATHLGILLVIVGLAMVVPAHFASKTNILEAMRYE